MFFLLTASPATVLPPKSWDAAVTQQGSSGHQHGDAHRREEEALPLFLFLLLVLVVLGGSRGRDEGQGQLGRLSALDHDLVIEIKVALGAADAHEIAAFRQVLDGVKAVGFGRTALVHLVGPDVPDLDDGAVDRSRLVLPEDEARHGARFRLGQARLRQDQERKRAD